jgi:uncharacterized RDD family membrane protein YckC
MRCPKCQYISFDSGDSCRNCGYQFSLSAELESLDLPIQTGNEPEGPFADLSLGERPSADLPLFGGRAPHDDRPLVSAPAVPRVPLSVRKAAPTPVRHPPRKDVFKEPELDLGMADDALSPPLPPPPAPVMRAVPAPARNVELSTREAAPTLLRMLAGLIDLAVIGAIDAGVLYFTLKLCGLEYREIHVLPIAPFAAFLLILNGGYFAAFTAAGGQSIGKMLAGVRVIPADDDAWTERVPLGQAVLRAAAYLVSALPAGLGFLPALVGAEKRAVHDRLAHTRVVRA